MPSEPDIGVDIGASGWMRDVADAAALCRRAALATLAAEGLVGAAVELDISLVDDAEIRELNRNWRGKDSATNVLSFPGFSPEELEAARAAEAGGRPALLGDVILAHQTVMTEARAQGKPPADHVAHLVVHGILHLLGHDHVGDAEAERMEAAEVAILAALGVPDPYRQDREAEAATAAQAR